MPSGATRMTRTEAENLVLEFEVSVVSDERDRTQYSRQDLRDTREKLVAALTTAQDRGE